MPYTPAAGIKIVICKAVFHFIVFCPSAIVNVIYIRWSKNFNMDLNIYIYVEREELNI